jgi:hypothetical protein
MPAELAEGLRFVPRTVSSRRDALRAATPACSPLVGPRRARARACLARMAGRDAYALMRMKRVSRALISDETDRLLRYCVPFPLPAQVKPGSDVAFLMLKSAT